MSRLTLFVFAGGAVGAAARSGLEKLFPITGAEFPWPTLCINVFGTFVLAWTATRLAAHPDPRERAFLISGFCGGLTTFATMQVELLTLADAGHGWIALAYATASIAAGLLIARIAVVAAARTVRPA
jgi:CrcB protein